MKWTMLFLTACSNAVSGAVVSFVYFCLYLFPLLLTEPQVHSGWYCLDWVSQASNRMLGQVYGNRILRDSFSLVLLWISDITPKIQIHIHNFIVVQVCSFWHNALSSMIRIILCTWNLGDFLFFLEQCPRADHFVPSRGSTDKASGYFLSVFVFSCFFFILRSNPLRWLICIFSNVCCGRTFSYVSSGIFRTVLAVVFYKREV